MEKKLIAYHQICDGCEIGQLQSELTDKLNAARSESYRKLADLASHESAGLESHTERLIARHGGDSFSGSEALRDMAAHAARLADGNVEKYRQQQPEQVVVCSQDGPTKFLHRCGAVAINRR